MPWPRWRSARSGPHKSYGVNLRHCSKRDSKAPVDCQAISFPPPANISSRSAHAARPACPITPPLPRWRRKPGHDEALPMRCVPACWPALPPQRSYVSWQAMLATSCRAVCCSRQGTGRAARAPWISSLRRYLLPRLFCHLAGCEFQAPQKCLRLIMVYAISFRP